MTFRVSDSFPGLKYRIYRRARGRIREMAMDRVKELERDQQTERERLTRLSEATIRRADGRESSLVELASAEALNKGETIRAEEVAFEAPGAR